MLATVVIGVTGTLVRAVNKRPRENPKIIHATLVLVYLKKVPKIRWNSGGKLLLP